jgi:hypothetical protein
VLSRADPARPYVLTKQSDSPSDCKLRSRVFCENASSANPSSEVADPFWRLPLSTFVYEPRGCSPWRPDADIGTTARGCSFERLGMRFMGCAGRPGRARASTLFPECWRCAARLRTSRLCASGAAGQPERSTLAGARRGVACRRECCHVVPLCTNALRPPPYL